VARQAAPARAAGRVRSRTLFLLVAATLAAALLAWALQRETTQGVAGLLVPGLGAQLNEVSVVVVEPAGAEPFRLERDADGWRVPAAAGYRADAAKIRRLVLGLAAARIVETKTSNPELHARLGVEEVEGQPGSGVLLRLEGIHEVPAILVGQREPRGGTGSYVRRLGEPAALLVDRELQPERTPVDWLEREILDVSPEEVESLAIIQPDGETLGIHRDELGVFMIAALPEGRQMSGPAAAEAVARALSGLRLDEVRPVAGWQSSAAPTVSTFRLRDGVVIEARSWPDGDEPWVAFTARLEPSGPEGEFAPEAAPRAEALNDRLSPWLYRLPAWKREQLTRRLEALLLPAGE
jgi:hypothetical protein